MNQDPMIDLENTGVSKRGALISFLEKMYTTLNKFLNRMIFFFCLGYFYSEWLHTYLLLELAGFSIPYVYKKMRSAYNDYHMGHGNFYVSFKEVFLNIIVLLAALMVLLCIYYHGWTSRKKTINLWFLFISTTYHVASNQFMETQIKEYYRYRANEDFVIMYFSLFFSMLSLVLSFCLMVCLLWNGYYLPACFCMALNVNHVFAMYCTTEKIVECYPYVTELELRVYSDVCGVCLKRMKRARTTHCCHYFHTFCLRNLFLKHGFDSTCPKCGNRLV